MDAEDQFIYDEEMQVCEHVLREVEKQSTENIVAENSLRLYERMLNGITTLHVLSEHARHEWAVDGVVILRTIHDAMLQLLWLLHDPGQRRQRAEMYPDYFHVDKLRMLAAIGDSGTDVAVLWGKRRPEVNPALRRDLTKYGPQFLSKEGRRQHRKRGDSYLYDPEAKYRRHWYPGELRGLAEDVGYLGEYKILHLDTSAAVHSSLWALLRGPALNPEFHLFCGTRFCLRAAGAVAEALGIPLTDDQVEKIERGEANIYNKPKRA